ncbi:MAG: dihydrofolate reductase family protein [Planctomycetota bacterium]
MLTTPQAAKTKKARMLLRKGVEVIACASKGGRLVLGDCLSRLSDRGVTNLLVEGGPTVLHAMLKARLVDEVWLFLAPKIIGGRSQAHALLSTPACRNPRSASVQRSGDDLHILVRLTNPRKRKLEVQSSKKPGLRTSNFAL